MADGVAHRINVSGGGVPKLPVAPATITELDVADDAHTDASHGDPDKALCLLGLEGYATVFQGGTLTTGDSITIDAQKGQTQDSNIVLNLART